MDTMQSTPTPEPGTPASSLAGIVASVKDFIGLTQDAQTEARKARKAALAPTIAQARARGEEVRRFVKEHGATVRDGERLLAAPELAADAALAQAARPLAETLAELRRQFTIPAHVERLIADVQAAETDEALGLAEAHLVAYTRSQCGLSPLPGLDQLRVQAEAQGERVSRRLETLRKNPPVPVSVMAHPAKFVEVDFTRPRQDVGGPILDFDVFENGGVQ